MSSAPPAKKQQLQQTMPAGGGVFIDAITKKHVATHPESLLQRRSLVWKKDYGWTYDVWVDDPGRHALSGAHSRFALPAIGQRIVGLLLDFAAATTSQLQAALPKQQQQQQKQQQQAAPTQR